MAPDSMKNLGFQDLQKEQAAAAAKSTNGIPEAEK